MSADTDRIAGSAKNVAGKVESTIGEMAGDNEPRQEAVLDSGCSMRCHYARSLAFTRMR